MNCNLWTDCEFLSTVCRFYPQTAGIADSDYMPGWTVRPLGPGQIFENWLNICALNPQHFLQLFFQRSSNLNGFFPPAQIGAPFISLEMALTNFPANYFAVFADLDPVSDWFGNSHFWHTSQYQNSNVRCQNFLVSRCGFEFWVLRFELFYWSKYCY